MMDVEFRCTLEIEGGDIEVFVEANVTPGRPAPPCQDHDSPAFCDSGDPIEVDIVSVKDEDGNSLWGKLTYKQIENLEEMAIDELEGSYDPYWGEEAR